ncbi:MAG: globin family protein [Microcoleaceae cyanobacterium]
MSLNVELLEYSFAQVKQHSGEFTATFYSTLFSEYPEVQPLFSHTQMQEQGKKLFKSLVVVVESLRHPAALITGLEGLGSRHVKYGVKPEHYPMVGNALLKTFAETLAAEWTPEVEQAWTEAYGAVAELMLAGADRSPDSASTD